MNEEEQKKHAVEEEDDEYGFPPRSTLHSTEKHKTTRLFYQSLFILFVVLTTALIGLGIYYFYSDI